MKLPIREVNYDFEAKRKVGIFSSFYKDKLAQVKDEQNEDAVADNQSEFHEEVVLKESKKKEPLIEDAETEVYNNGEKGFFSGFIAKLKTSRNLQSVLLITFFLLVSKALGFLRSVLILDTMDKVSSDLLIAASKIPEMITLVLVMGTIASSLLPMASKIKEKLGDRKMVDFMNLFQIPLLLLMLFVTIGFYTFAEEILKATTSSQYWSILTNNGLISDYIFTAQVLLLGPIIFALQAFFGVFLSIKKRFLVYSLAGVISNIGAIGGILIAGQNGYLETAWGMVAGAAVATLLYWLRSINLGFFYRFNLVKLYREFKPYYWQIWKVFIPRMFIISGLIVAGLLINMFTDSKGQVTALEFAFSIQGIFFVLVTSLSTVIFPDLSKLWNQSEGKNKTKFFKSLKYYSENTVLLAVLGTVVTFLGVDLVMWFISQFAQGQGTNDYISFLTRILALGIIFQSLNEILSKYFYIRHRTWQPVFISLFSLFSQVIVTIFLISKFEFDPAVSVSLGVVFNFLVASLISIYFIKKDYGFELNKPLEI